MNDGLFVVLMLVAIFWTIFLTVELYRCFTENPSDARPYTWRRIKRPSWYSRLRKRFSPKGKQERKYY